MIFHAFYKNRISMLREGVAQWDGEALPSPECIETYKKGARRTLRGRSEDAQRRSEDAQRTSGRRSEAAQKTFRGALGRSEAS